MRWRSSRARAAAFAGILISRRSHAGAFLRAAPLTEKAQCRAAAGLDTARLHFTIDAAQLIADLLQPRFGHRRAIVIHQCAAEALSELPAGVDHLVERGDPIG